MGAQTVHYKLELFEGPLDLLLHLIEKSEVDIYDISVSEITDQYMVYIAAMQELELEVTSEFLVMASTLLYMKSKMLLPKLPVVEEEKEEESEEALREQLIQKLIEYRKYKEIAELLREKELNRSLIYTREPEDLSPFAANVRDNPVHGLHVADLIIAFQKVLRKTQQSDPVTKIRRDEISVVQRMDDVLNRLQLGDGHALFSDLFMCQITREEIVVTFLAILELMKMKKIVCSQSQLFDDIMIVLRVGEGCEIERAADEIRY